MKREDVAERIKECLKHLTPDEDKPEFKELEFTADRPRKMFPNITRFVLCEMLGLKCEWHPWDKVRWAVSATYRGLPVRFEDRKMGFAVIRPTTMAPEMVAELEARLRGGVQILSPYLRAVSREKIESGNFTVVNNFADHDGAYGYFRERAKASYAEPPPPPIVHQSGFGTSTSWDTLKPEREGGFNTVAMVHEYFSRLEHVLILLLPTVSSFDPTNGRVRDLISAGWKEKFKAVFDLGADLPAKRLLDRLLDLKEAVRNPRAHGGFLKDAGSAWFHMEGIGALPMDLVDHDVDWLWIDSPRYEEICALFDEFDKFLDTHPVVGTGMLAVRGHLDARFDSESLAEYRTALELSRLAGQTKPFVDFIDGEHYRSDAFANYED